VPILLGADQSISGSDICMNIMLLGSWIGFGHQDIIHKVMGTSNNIVFLSRAAKRKEGRKSHKNQML
jgi:hypothetical protein